MRSAGSRVIGITLGDINGIGPEIALKAAYHRRWPGKVTLALVGSRNSMAHTAAKMRVPLPPAWIPGTPPPTRVVMWDPQPDLVPQLDPGHCTAGAGHASALWIESAVSATLRGDLAAVVTAPINKAGWAKAGIHFPGHTEMIAGLTHTKRFAMMLIGGPLRVILATRHVALKDVPRSLTRAAIVEAGLMAGDAVIWMGLRNQQIGVCALNPHAGDGGLLGDEERRIISPAIAMLRRRGIDALGPLPADVIFHQAFNKKFGIVVAMYHDQGLGPLKMIGFETGVNVTLGLPIVRTSPDHGTAYDIAGKGLANPASMRAAIDLAIKLAGRPNPWSGLHV